MMSPSFDASMDTAGFSLSLCSLCKSGMIPPVSLKLQKCYVHIEEAEEGVPQTAKLDPLLPIFPYRALMMAILAWIPPNS